MMQVRRLGLALLLGVTCYGQDITVHVINDKTQKPVEGISALLRTDCKNPKRPKALEQKTDATGATVFHSVSIAKEAVCINLFSIAYKYAPHTLDYMFVSPEQAERYKSLNPVVTTLPALVTFHVQKRGFGERLELLFRGHSNLQSGERR